jgi:hypothetical protein
MSLEIHIPVGPQIFQDSHYVLVNDEEIIFRDTMMETKQVIGFAYGPVEIVRNGISAGVHYEILLEDVAADTMKLMLVKHPSNEISAEQYYTMITEALWRHCGDRMLKDLISNISRGFTEQFGVLTLNTKGASILFSPLFGKDREESFSWDEIDYKLDNGSLVVFNRSNPKISTQLSLAQTINAQLLYHFLHLLRTASDLKIVLKGERKV